MSRNNPRRSIPIQRNVVQFPELIADAAEDEGVCDWQLMLECGHCVRRETEVERLKVGGRYRVLVPLPPKKVRCPWCEDKEAAGHER